MSNEENPHLLGSNPSRTANFAEQNDKTGQSRAGCLNPTALRASRRTLSDPFPSRVARSPRPSASHILIASLASLPATIRQSAGIRRGGESDRSRAKVPKQPAAQSE
jgi:hypothetical protein